MATSFSCVIRHSQRSFLFSPRSFVGLQVAQLSKRDRAAGWVSFGQKWKTINILQTANLSPLWRNRPQKLSNSVK